MRRRSGPSGTIRARTAALLATALLAGCDRDVHVAYDLVEGASVARAESERVAIDVGDPASRRYLERGFSWAERTGDGRTFAWSSGPESVVRFELHSTEPRLLVLRGFPYQGSPAAAPAEPIELYLNGRPLGTLVLDAEGGVQVVHAGSGSLRLGSNRLAVRYRRTYRRGTGATGGARRGIAVAWDAFGLLELARPDSSERPAEELQRVLREQGPDTGSPPRAVPGGLRIAPSNALSWTVDVGPGAELWLHGVDALYGISMARGDAPEPSLAVWLTVPGTDGTDEAPRLLGVIDPGGAAPATIASLPLGLDRFGTAVLTLAVRQTPAADGTPQAWMGVRGARVVYSLSSPSASPGASRRAEPRAPAARPG